MKLVIEVKNTNGVYEESILTFIQDVVSELESQLIGDGALPPTRVSVEILIEGTEVDDE